MTTSLVPENEISNKPGAAQCCLDAENFVPLPSKSGPLRLDS